MVTNIQLLLVYYTNSYLLQWHYCMRGLYKVMVWQQPRVIEKKFKEFSAEFTKNKPHKMLHSAPTFTTDPTHGFKRKTLRVKWNTRPAIRLLRNFCSQLCSVSTTLTSNFTERYQSLIQSVNQNEIFFFLQLLETCFTCSFWESKEKQ